VASALGPDTASFVRDLIVSQSQRQTSDSLVLSVVNLAILLFVASGLFGALEDILNAIWGNPFPAEQGVIALIRTQFLAFLLVIGVGLVIVLLTATDFLLALLARFFDLSTSLGFLNSAVLVFFTIVGFGILYRLLARKKAPWRYIWLGAVAAAVLFNLGKWFFAWFLQITNFSSAYAAAGVLAVILLAVYYSALIFLVGAMLIRVVPETQNKVINNG
jgi:membrane protein